MIENNKDWYKNLLHNWGTNDPEIIVDVINDLFIHPGPGKYFQSNDGKSYNYLNEVVTEEDIKNHLKGQVVLGVPVSYADNDSSGAFIKNVVIDVDVLHDIWAADGFDYANYSSIVDEQIKVLADQAELFDLPYYTEFSGFKGKHIIIFFDDYVPLDKAYWFLHGIFGKDIVPNVSDKIIAWELFPKSSMAGSKSMVKLPYAAHRKSGNRSEWVNSCFPEGRPKDIKKLPASRVLELTGPLWSQIVNCKALRDVYRKAKYTHALSNQERVTIASLFKDIMDGAGIEFILKEFLSRCSNYVEATSRYHLEKMTHGDYKAISCTAMQDAGICHAQCSRIKESKSPYAFHFRALSDPRRETALNDKISNSQYFIKGDCFYKNSKDGPIQLSDFTMFWRRSLVRLDKIDDQETTSYYVEVAKDNQKFEVHIPNSYFQDFQKLAIAVSDAIHIPITIYCTLAEFKRAVNQFSADELKQIDCYNSPGWSTDYNTYITPSLVINKQGITPNERFMVDKGNIRDIGLRSFDMIPTSDEEFESLKMLVRDNLMHTTHDQDVCLAMGGYAAYSIMEPLIRNVSDHGRFSMFILGRTGGGKTTAATNFFRLFGPFDKGASWVSTGNSALAIGYHLCNGGLFLLDDYQKTFATSKDAIKIFQMYADNQGRSRLDTSQKLRNTLNMRGGLLVTGEYSFTGSAAAEARMIVLNVDKEPDAALRERNRKLGLAKRTLCGFFPRFIHQILNEDQDEWAREIVENTIMFENQIKGHTNNKSRVCGNFAILLFCTRKFIWYTYPLKEREACLELVTKLLHRLILEQLVSIAASGIDEQFLNILQLGLETGKALIIKPGDSDEAKAILRSDKHHIIAVRTRSNQEYLLPNQAEFFVQKLCRERGESWDYPQRAVLKELIIKGVISSSKQSVRINGFAVNVYKLLKNPFEKVGAISIDELDPKKEK